MTGLAHFMSKLCQSHNPSFTVSCYISPYLPLLTTAILGDLISPWISQVRKRKVRVKNIFIEPPPCLLKYEGEGKAADLKRKTGRERNISNDPDISS